MRLKPLEQWFCDVCDGIIEKPEDGYTIWRTEKVDDTYIKTDFKIIHATKCDLNDYNASSALTDYLGNDGLSALLGHIDLGIALDPDGESEYPINKIKNLTEFLDFLRRLQTPLYEEARRCFRNANNDDYFDGSSESWPYREEQLKTVIERYNSED